MLLDRITVRGFKSIDVVEQFALQPRNVLIGANGVGKSNLLSLFDFFEKVTSGQLSNFVRTQGGANVLLHHGVKTTQRLHVDLDFWQRTNGYALTLAATPQDGLVPIAEEVRFWDQRYPRPLVTELDGGGTEAAIRDAYLPGAGHYVHRGLNRLQRFHFHDTSRTSPLRQSSQRSDNMLLRGDGANLAAVLLGLREHERSGFILIEKALRLVAPYIQELILEPQPEASPTVRIRWRHAESGVVFDVSALSDGTLRFLALATALLQKPAPDFVIIDEPELGLHPVAIRLLASIIRSVSSAEKPVQVLAATQSTLLLDEFAPEDVVVADLQQGATRLRRLVSAELESWLEDYSLGELWEKNQLGGRPE